MNLWHLAGLLFLVSAVLWAVAGEWVVAGVNVAAATMNVLAGEV